jgi:hypothetical protein
LPFNYYEFAERYKYGRWVSKCGRYFLFSKKPVSKKRSLNACPFLYGEDFQIIMKNKFFNYTFGIENNCLAGDL